MLDKFSEDQIIFEQLLKEPDIRAEKKIFDELTGETTIWWLVGRNAGRKFLSAVNLNGESQVCNKMRESCRKKICRDCIIRNVKAAAGSAHPLEFTCHYSFYGIAIPIGYNGEAKTFLGICHINESASPLAIENLNTAVRIIVDKIKKEQELHKLYETVRPRAIALSTVHTVHRLISSTLNLGELLPRIARLSLQVMRAKKCVIMLVDPVKKTLVPKTYININKKPDANLKKIGLRANLEKEIVRTGRIYLGNKCICVPLVDQEIIGTIRVEDKQDSKPFTNSDQEILTVLAEQAVIAIRNAQLYEDRGKMLWGSIKSLGAILDARLPDAYTHPIGFVEIVLEIGKEMKLPEEDMESLKYAALLLDAGKIGVPDAILMKPTKLTGKEYGLIKEHPVKGAEIVSSIEAMKPAIPLIMHHHERFDGKGYPMELKRNQIPLGARIIALADAFEAMICKRPYKGSMKINDAVKEIEESSGTQFDPAVVKAFLNLVKKGKVKNIICRLQKRIVE